MEQTTTNNLFCEVCDLHMNPNNYELHINGRKHKLKQEQYDKAFKTIFVTGVGGLQIKDLQKIFWKYGEISKTTKNPQKPFAFITFTQKEAVEKALGARVFAGGKRICVHKYKDPSNNPFTNNKEKSRKLSETSSNSSQVETAEALPEGSVGVKELPVRLAKADSWSGDDVVLWQAQDAISQVELPPEMYQSLDEVISDVETIFKPVLPNCQVLIFGSCGSTLAFKNSDVDLFLKTGDEQPRDFVRREAKEMYRSRLFKVLARIPSARVPIVKFEHVGTGWQGDLTANSPLGVCNSQLIRFLVSLDYRIKPLVMTIKYWAKVCGITGSNSQFTTYSVVMLVILYLQQLEEPMLPTIAQLQQMTQHKQYSLGWECSFCDEEWRVQSECLSVSNNLTFRQLLTGFFRYYYNFNLDNVACPLLGNCLPVKDFESNDGSLLPDEMFLYREYLKEDPKGKFRTDTIFKVQDPFELCLNITRNVSERTCSILKEACKISLELCEKVDDNMLLESIFSIDRQSLDKGDTLTIKLNCTKTVAENSSAFEEWCQLTKESIMLVLKQIYKFEIAQVEQEVVSKVKKLESSQDVHTQMNTNQESKEIKFVCSGKVNVWDSRKKISTFMNKINVHLKPFEMEVCISNALFHPSNKKPLSLSTSINLYEDEIKSEKGLSFQVSAKDSRHLLFKGFLSSIKSDFKVFVDKASQFIVNVKKSSPLTEVQESLKELFEVKLKSLPDIKKLFQDEKDTTVGKEQSGNKLTEKQKTTNKQGNVKTANSKSFHVKEKSKKHNLSPEKLSAREKCIDKFFNPSIQGESSKSSESSEHDKFNNLLNAIQKIETQSTFSSDNVNPFLASIEKVAASKTDNKPIVQDQDGSGIIKMDDVEQAKGEKINKTLEEDVAVFTKEKELKNNVQDKRKINIQEEQTHGKLSKYIDVDKLNSETKVIPQPDVCLDRPMEQQKPNQSKADGTPRTWVGGGPPGCQQWQKPDQNISSESLRLQSVIEQQKKWYPGLLKSNKNRNTSTKK